MTGRQDGNGGKRYGTDNYTVIDDNKQSSPTPNTGWFDQLVVIVTGKSDRDPQQQEQEQEQEEESERIQDKTQSYCNQGGAFLGKTEKGGKRRWNRVR